MKSIKEQLSEEFRDKLLKTCYAFEDAKDNSPEKIENWEKERDNISAFLSQAIDRTREETIKEVEEMLNKIVLKDLSGKWSEEVIDFSTSIVDATVLKIKQSLKSLINNDKILERI